MVSENSDSLHPKGKSESPFLSYRCGHQTFMGVKKSPLKGTLSSSRLSFYDVVLCTKHSFCNLRGHINIKETAQCFPSTCAPVTDAFG